MKKITITVAFLLSHALVFFVGRSSVDGLVDHGDSHDNQSIVVHRDRPIESNDSHSEGSTVPRKDLLTSSNNPHSRMFRAITASGSLTTGAAENLEMSSYERKAVEKMLSSIWEEMTRSFAARAVLDEVKSDSEKGEFFYRIPALPDRGRATLTQLKSNFIQILGQERGLELFNSFSPRTALGGFGSFDTTLKFSSPDSNRAIEDSWVTLRNYNPESGNEMNSAAMIFGLFKEKYGDAFSAVVDR